MKRILVCGIGNRIMGDDGFAQHVLEFLGNELPDNVESGDFGTASLTMGGCGCAAGSVFVQFSRVRA